MTRNFVPQLYIIALTLFHVLLCGLMTAMTAGCWCAITVVQCDGRKLAMKLIVWASSVGVSVVRLSLNSLCHSAPDTE